MKYIELKASLKQKPKSAYLIFGDDRYLCYDALKKIESSLNFTLSQMNCVTISGESTTAREIIESANLYPFGDEYRLVIVKNFNPSKDKQAFSVIQDYLNQPLSSTILVFFSPDGSEFFKGMKNIETIDCSKIDAKTIAAFVKNHLAKLSIGSNDEAIDKLILYCNFDMARVTSELEKLAASVLDTKILTPEIVEKNVTQDREFQVFQLAEFIAKGDGDSANKLIDSIMVKAGMGFTILSPLYNNYRRALFVSINKDKTNAELATLLSVKEFAIKMLKNQVMVFSAKQLKIIVDMLADYDRKIKVGEMKESVAIKTIVFNILNLRGKWWVRKILCTLKNQGKIASYILCCWFYRLFGLNFIHQHCRLCIHLNMDMAMFFRQWMLMLWLAQLR